MIYGLQTLHAQSDKLNALVADGEKLANLPGGEYTTAIEDVSD